jgi:hypothetical protein
MPNPAYPNGYSNALRPGYDPTGHAAGVGLDYDYILSHPPDMSHMPPVRPEAVQQVNQIGQFVQQYNSVGYTDDQGWYHPPGKPPNHRRNLDAGAFDPQTRSLDAGGGAGASERSIDTGSSAPSKQ